MRRRLSQFALADVVRTIGLVLCSWLIAIGASCDSREAPRGKPAHSDRQMLFEWGVPVLEDRKATVEDTTNAVTYVNAALIGLLPKLTREEMVRLHDALARAMESEDAKLRREAVFALGYLGQRYLPAQALALRALLMDPELEVRTSAASGLTWSDRDNQHGLLSVFRLLLDSPQVDKPLKEAIVGDLSRFRIIEALDLYSEFAGRFEDESWRLEPFGSAPYPSFGQPEEFQTLDQWRSWYRGHRDEVYYDVEKDRWRFRPKGEGEN